MDTLASRQAPAHGRLGSLACLLLLALLPAMSAAAKLRVSVSRPHPPAHRLQLWIDTPLDEGTCVVLASGPGVNRRLGNPLLPSVVKVRPMAQPAGHDREHHHDAADELHVHKRTDLAGLLTSVHAPDASLTQGSISEIFAPSVTRAYDLARLRHGCNTFLDIDEALGQLDMVAPRYEAPHHGVGAFNTTDEIVDLAVSGEPLNRIDIVFMGDGYTGPERGLFMSDMRRMTDDLFDSPTFYSYLPLFNVWGLYRPSVDSGIGVDSTPRNTSFGLYRVGTELRAIYTSRPLEALRACHALGDGNCDFPSLIGNDAFYGGLGGTFAISTSSHTSGSMVLRHELGHNLVDVGEEYDGGSAYFGGNFAKTPETATWRHWLTDADAVPEGSQLLAQAYPWYDLANGPFRVPFHSTGNYSSWQITFSASGVETPDSLEVWLDGHRVPWRTAHQLDRSFFSIQMPVPMAAGDHELVFVQGSPPATGQIRQLCNLVVHEFPENYHFENSHVGFYPVWHSNGQLWGYRPNHEHCLMRNMTSVNFCDACRETLWLELLAKVSLIDGIRAEENSRNGTITISLDLMPFGHLRQPRPIAGEQLLTTWYRVVSSVDPGVHQPQFDNMHEWTAPAGWSRGMWRADVELVTPEVRRDDDGLLRDSIFIRIE